MRNHIIYVSKLLYHTSDQAIIFVIFVIMLDCKYIYLKKKRFLYTVYKFCEKFSNIDIYYLF